jgi:nucleoporin NUP82
MHRALVRQGPLLVDPEPEEARNGDDMDEDMATDLVILSVTDSDGGKATKPDGEKGAESDADSKEEKAPESEPVNVFAIAWAGGRVDLGVEIHPTEPRWISSRDPAEEALVMSVIESVLVPFPAGTDEALNAPMFVPDPIHPAVVYLQHAFGVNAISVQPWAAQLLSGGELKPTDVACLVQASPSKPIVGMVTFCNITLGYGLLALATTGQLGAVELDFRVQDTGLAVQSTPIEETEADTQSLLSSPFDVDALLANIEKTAFNPRAAVRKLPDAGKPLTTIGPEHVRALAEVSDQVGARALAIGKASADTEARLDLALTEYRRQLGVLRAASQGITDVRSRAAANAERTASMAAAQAALGARLDAVLAALLAEYRPEIGAVERAWFDELERLRARIQGSGGLGRRPAPGMAQRSQVLREQLAVVTPLAKGLNKGDEDGQYGNRQLKPLRAALDGRSDELARMMRRVEALSIRVGEEDVEDEEEREDQ